MSRQIKRVLGVLFLLPLSLALIGCSKGKMIEGSYQGTGRGYNDDIVLEITVAEGRISLITILENDETEQYYNMAESILGEIIAKGGVEGIDVVAGATGSSKGILEAASEALENAYE